MAELLIRKEQLHTGHYELAVKFTMTVANFEHPSGTAGPGVLSVVDGIGLVEVAAPTKRSVDASIVNPAPGRAKKAKAVRHRGALPGSE